MINTLYYNTLKIKVFQPVSLKKLESPQTNICHKLFSALHSWKRCTISIFACILTVTFTESKHSLCMPETHEKKKNIIVYQRINFHLSSACLLFVSQLALTKHASDVQLKVTDLSVRPLWQNCKIKKVLTATGFHQIGLLLNFNKTPSQK